MNGLRNAANNAAATSGGGGVALQWKVGLVNHQGKYLTAETFGFKLNASGLTLRKKQQWTIEHDAGGDDDVVYVRSHLGRYLAGDKKGLLTCAGEERTPAEQFLIQYCPDGSGRWSLRNRSTGYYVGGTEDQLQCYEKQPGTSEWWILHLAIHPQVTLRNVNRQRYARLDAANSRLTVTDLIPWGSDALITLEFRDWKYCVRSSDNRYLHRDGSLVDHASPDTLFTLEIRSGQLAGMAIRDCTGKCLTAVGRDAVVQAKNKAVGKDELFIIDDSHPQVFFTAHNNKMVSTKQGVDLTANHDDELTDRETFQIEFEKKGDQIRIRTVENKYWSLESASGIQSVGNSASPTGLFSIEYLDTGVVALKANNGRYLTARMNGSLYAVSDAPTEKERFIMTVVNRPILVLKCEYGFVGFRSPNNPRYECNKASYDVIYLLPTQGQTAYFLQGHNGRFWSVDAEGNLNADQAAGQPFFLELRGQSKLAIKAPNGHYIKGEQNGIMTAKSDLQKATLWEY